MTCSNNYINYIILYYITLLHFSAQYNHDKSNSRRGKTSSKE